MDVSVGDCIKAITERTPGNYTVHAPVKDEPTVRAFQRDVDTIMAVAHDHGFKAVPHPTMEFGFRLFDFVTVMIPKGE